MANVAVINGSSRCVWSVHLPPVRSREYTECDMIQNRGLGLAFSRYLLSNTSLNVISTSSRDASKARSAILEDSNLDKNEAEERLTTLDLDVTDEGSIEKAANHVKSKFGSGNLRLLINVAGIVGLNSIWRFSLRFQKR